MNPTDSPPPPDETARTEEDESALQGVFDTPGRTHTVYERCLRQHDTLSNEPCLLCQHLLDWHNGDGRCNVCNRAISARYETAVYDVPGDCDACNGWHPEGSCPLQDWDGDR